MITECLATCYCPAVSDHEVMNALASSDAIAVPIVTDANVLRILCEQLAVPLLQRMRRSALRTVYTSAAALVSIKSHTRALRSAAGRRADSSEDPLQYWAVGGVLQPLDGTRVWAPATLLHFLTNVVSASNPFSDARPDPLLCLRLTMSCQLLACLFDSLKREGVEEIAPDYAAGRPPRAASDTKTPFTGFLTDSVAGPLRLLKVQPAAWHVSTP